MTGFEVVLCVALALFLLGWLKFVQAVDDLVQARLPKKPPTIAPKHRHRVAPRETGAVLSDEDRNRLLQYKAKADAVMQQQTDRARHFNETLLGRTIRSMRPTTGVLGSRLRDHGPLTTAPSGLPDPPTPETLNATTPSSS